MVFTQRYVRRNVSNRLIIDKNIFCCCRHNGLVPYSNGVRLPDNILVMSLRSNTLLLSFRHPVRADFFVQVDINVILIKYRMISLLQDDGLFDGTVGFNEVDILIRVYAAV